MMHTPHEMCLTLVLLLAACPGQPPPGQPPPATNCYDGPIPACAPGQGLRAGPDGIYACEGLPAWPDCQEDQTLLRDDASGIMCHGTGITQDLTDRIAAVASGLSELEQQAQGLQMPKLVTMTFAGTTRLTTTGAMSRAGAEPGLAAAAALCNDEYAGSHMCSVQELFEVLSAGRMTAAVKAWIYLPSWKTPIPAAQDPLEGPADNCGGYTYDGAAFNWAGVAMEYTTLPTGDMGLKFHGGDLAPCSGKLPIACCKPIL